MANYSIHLRFLAQIHKKILMRELFIWRHNSSLKSKELKDCKLIASKNIENLKNNLWKINSSAKNKISTIFESSNERSPSPTGDVFEELKSSLNLKVIKFDKNKGMTGGKGKAGHRLEKSESIQVIRIEPEIEKRSSIVLSPNFNKTLKNATINKYHSEKANFGKLKGTQVKKHFSKPS